jgi:hypothetical protein
MVEEGLGFVFRRVASLVCAAAMGAAVLIGSAATAQAQPQCPDLHWIGAAGSGERTPAEVTMNDGMGRVVYKSMLDLATQLAQDGRTMTSEAVVYPATAVPDDDAGVGEWMGFMSSVDEGTAALGRQYAAFVAQCPTSRVVLAGYSQGAMVVHRNLQALGVSPNFAAALLVADGDRLPNDSTLNVGSVTSVPGKGKGVAQDWPILAHTPAPLTPNIGSRTISVCDLGDAVCDYDPDADDDMNPLAVAIHTSYATSSGGYSWTSPLYQLVAAAPALGPAPVAGPAPMPA